MIIADQQSPHQCHQGTGSGHQGRGAWAALVPRRSPICLAGAAAAGRRRTLRRSQQPWGLRVPTCVERSLEAAGFPSLTQSRHKGCPGALPLSIQGRDTGEVSCRMVHGRARWKCLHLIRKVIKDMALFQQQKRSHYEIPTLAKISHDISEWSFTDIFTEVCSFVAGKNLTPLFNHVTPHFHWLPLSLLPFS